MSQPLVTAKFKVAAIKREAATVPQKDAGTGETKYVPGEVKTITLRPVYGDGNPESENSKFWDATPAGEINLTCANASAASVFELDKEYYVDFRQAN